jgi:hypothetical protein
MNTFEVADVVVVKPENPTWSPVLAYSRHKFYNNGRDSEYIYPFPSIRNFDVLRIFCIVLKVPICLPIGAECK